MSGRHLAARLIGGAALATGLLLGSACSTPADQTTSASASAEQRPQLSPAAFAEAVKQPGTVLIDVRTPAEFAAGHLAGARNIDVEADTFTATIAELDKQESYAVYCRSGRRSADAAKIMSSAGFTTVVDLAGGINAWTAAGGPVTTN